MARLLGLLGFLSVITAVFAETNYCNATLSCPQEYPCCSSGVCGTGVYCINACNPMFSYSFDACMPLPVCKNSTTTFSNYTSKVVDANTFLGDVSEGDWAYTGYILDYEDEDSMILAMPKNSGGTVLSSTRSVWYGKVSARLKTSHLAGVITAFIIYSGVADEIDCEFVGVDLETEQTNFFWQATLNYTNSVNATISSDSFDNFHTYTIDWQEEYIEWSIDGVVSRTLYKNETYNATSGVYQYPQTPSKIDISIWPGGNATNSIGTIEWAGGEIDWNATDITTYPGYYYMILDEVNITCYGPPSGTSINGTSAYVYTSNSSFLQKDIAITDAETSLGSSEGTGLDPDAGVSSSSSASSSSTLSSSSSSSSASSKKSSSSNSSTNTEAATSTSGSKSKSAASSASGSSSSANLGSTLGLGNIYVIFSIIFGYLL
ncbi:hypothetical protein KAFR_0E00500 [Kazachstania africana CBS 2517]|uniref:Crh-like protein n=1 Tax=Kazachstania africana (strain ATCC 22294 / BCRC 22015 / CBS 2517 / CECT 1963 / NBRC 1671 / NRRL Y-8276) TaxID=1071382 RepID=H2AV04_KAZAF|nr:hypothetical protein KAFR_0E00500 [Kazachstania africana CBS 2517]CCF58204.1 hypothetical protein KAFR_0E00500 [Kazachstania africana CBS 2517]